MGEYELLGELGRGAMGVVYKARDLKLGRLVALKMIRSAAHASQTEVTRFLAEARAEARLDHPNIVPVYDIGEWEGLPYFAMALVEGGSLHQRLAEGPLPAKVAAGVVRQVAEAIQHAHERGVLHRDLKPQNILLQQDGGPVPKVSDFGLARLMDQDGMTATGDVLGTPSYMPPEQAAGLTHDVGPHSDVYSLGAVLYCLLTGRPPFQAATLGETLRQVRDQEAAPPRRLNTAVPRDLETVCLKCLEKDPGRRYASAAALAEDLRRFEAGEPVLAVPAGPITRTAKWVRRRPVVAGLLVLVALVAVAGAGSFAWAYRQAVRESEHARQEAARADDEARRATESLEDALAANKRRVRGQVEQLCTAAPQAVPDLLTALQPERAAALPHLVEMWDKGGAGGSQSSRMRLAIALLPDRPALENDVLSWMLSAEDPREMLLARDALTPVASHLRGALWERATGKSVPVAARFRALVALAAFDPADPRWRGLGPLAVEQLLKTNPLFLGVWTKALQPVAPVLMEPLGDVFRGRTQPERRAVATEVLADYARDQPALLADLTADSDAGQLAALLPYLERHRARVVECLQKELSRSPDRPDLAKSPDPVPLPRAISGEVEAAGGMVTQRFAFCQTLPGERAASVIADLRAAGYRPINYRPYLAGGQVRLAAVWLRDRKDFRSADGLATEALRREDEKQRSEGFVPLDVASYFTGQGLRHSALWARKEPGVGDARLYVGVADAWHSVSWEPLQKAGFVPLTQVQVDGPQGARWHSAVWRKPEKPQTGANFNYRLSESDYEDNLTIRALQTDVRVERSSPARSSGKVETLRRQLEQAEKALAKNPQDDNGNWQAGWTLLALGRPGAAIPHLDSLIAKYPKVPVAMRQRTLARARTGDAAGARADAATALALPSGLDDRLVLEAQVSALLGEEAASVKRLDAAVSANAGSAGLLYAAARAYALVAEESARRETFTAATAAGPGVYAATMLPDAKSQSTAFCKKAVDLLRRAVSAGYRDFEHMADDPDLAFVSHQPGFVELVRRGHLEQHYSAAWHVEPTLESVESHGLDPTGHLERCRKLAAEGWQPVSVSVAETETGRPPVTASVWQRPAESEAARETRARRKAAAAAALLRLGEADSAWPVLRQTPEPDARSYVIRDLGPRGVEVAAVAARLEDEKDASVRRALILALGEYSEEQLPPALKADLMRKLLAWYRSDPDAGIHGAIDWLLRHDREGAVPRKAVWGQEAALAAIDRELAGTPAVAPRRWLVTKSGFTMSAVAGPVEFWMGSPSGEPLRAEDETRHRRRIVRGFAVATKPVTVALFKEFLRASPPDVPTNYAEAYSPDEQCPVNGVDWFTAVKFCRWLSEREGIPESEMCYPPMGEIKEGMRGITGDPGRMGYRLPTEAEWEYVCRAGTETPRHFGGDEELLPRYAWYARNSNNRTWPVGQKRPNDLGMFDVLGGVWNWCQGHYGRYGGGGYREDEELADFKGVKDSESRTQRGGTFESQPTALRCAYRNANRPSLRILNVGLRVARSLPQDSSRP